MDEMMGPVGTGLVAALIVVLIAVWQVRLMATVSKPSAPVLLSQSAAILRDAMETASDLVAAAEQLWLTGVIDGDERFDYVFDHLKALYPDLPREQVEATIEAAVYWFKLGMARRDGGAEGERAPESHRAFSLCNRADPTQGSLQVVSTVAKAVG